MWYVIQVRTGSEETVKRMCQRMISSTILEDSFVPRYEKKKRYHGRWHTEEVILFPGYVFVVTEDEEQLFHHLKKIPDLTKILGDEDGAIPLYKEEIKFLQSFINKEHVVEMSYGYREGDIIVITDGPMKGYEGLIKKIDRHKRVAMLEVPFFGRTTQVWVGLELLVKDDRKNDL